MSCPAFLPRPAFAAVCLILAPCVRAAGSVSGTAVPEPGAGWLIAVGLALTALGTAGRRKWSHRSPGRR